LAVWTQTLAEKLASKEIFVFSLHPGAVATDIWRGLPDVFQWIGKKILLSTAEGTKPVIYCALDTSVCQKINGHFINQDLSDWTLKLEQYVKQEIKGDFHSKIWSDTLIWTGVGTMEVTDSKIELVNLEEV